MDAGFDYRKKLGRREYVRVRLTAGSDLPVAHRFPRDGAGVLSSVVASDGLLVIDENTPGIGEGDRLPFLPWSAFE